MQEVSLAVALVLCLVGLLIGAGIAGFLCYRKGVSAGAEQRKQQAEACELFCGLALRDGCTACGLCTVVCPTGAVVLERGEHAALHFAGASCTGCNLCALHCPQGALELVPHFAGQREFPLDR